MSSLSNFMNTTSSHVTTDLSSTSLVNCLCCSSPVPASRARPNMLELLRSLIDDRNLSPEDACEIGAMCSDYLELLQHMGIVELDEDSDCPSRSCSPIRKAIKY